MTRRSGWWLLPLALTLSACGTGGKQRAVVRDAVRPSTPVLKPVPSAPVAAAPAPAPALKKVAPVSADWRPPVHVVKKGDTLYSIAFNYGMDYRELAELNGIQNPAVIKIGQEIRLFPQAAKPEVTAPPAPQPVMVAVAPELVAEARKPAEIPVKTAPKAFKLPYSEQAIVQMEALPDWTKPTPVAPVAAAPITPESKPPLAAEAMPPKPTLITIPSPPVVVAPPAPPPAKVEAPKPPESASSELEGTVGDDEAIVWIAPTTGKVIGEFSENANRKGVDIAGKHGQPVYASAAGKVVYSGSGLRGYGKLIILKHNKTYISAYAHNDKILVKERQQVAKGDKIAEMGNTDSEQVKLHFEIRKFGKPIDPAKLLPPIKP